MNLLDVVLLALLVLALVVGAQVGLLARLAGWGGLAIGITASVLAIPVVLRVLAVPMGPGRLLIGLLVLFVVSSLGSGVGRAVGVRAREAVAATPLGGIDRAGGAVLGALSLLLLVWLVAPAAGDVPGSVARAVRGSAVVAAVVDVAPPAPPALLTLRDALADVPFPEVLGPLRPAPVTGPPPAQLPVAPEVVARARRSVVNVEGRGCGALAEGSGWVVAPGLVVTNAHVVGGVEAGVEVRRDDGTTLPARVVVADRSRDLALLEVDGLDRLALPVAEPSPGEEAVVLGHPLGQDEVRVAPARVDDVGPTVGRELDGRRAARREVVFLAAQLQRGDSGAPVVDDDGAVVGTVFAIAPDVATTAYALAPAEVRAVLDAPRVELTTSTCG